jgi:hypothetical protein
MTPLIKPKERSAILQSLAAGVVPRAGLHHLQVGRKDEVAAALKDLTTIEQGGAAVRFIIGRFGSGKSFFLNLCRVVALQKRFVVAQADLTVERRLQGTGGQARSLYAELLKNLAILAKPDGGALPSIVERWVSDVQHAIHSVGGTHVEVTKEIHERLKPLQELVSGYDFAAVIVKYLEGFLNHKEALAGAALRWLRAEYTTRTEARQDLGVRSIIDDADIYDHLKLLAAFVRMAGYAGLLVNLDEMGVLSHRLNHSKARDNNYEAILRIVNDCIQGGASGIGFYFAGVDDFLDDRRRGLVSHEALRTRLQDNLFARSGLKDFSGPVIRLANLTREELFVLLHKIRDIFVSADTVKIRVDDEAIQGFMDHASRTLGATYFQMPRDIIRPFVSLLSILEQNPDSDWRMLVSGMQFEGSADPDLGLPLTEPAPVLKVSPGEQPSSADPGEHLRDFRL